LIFAYQDLLETNPRAFLVLVGAVVTALLVGITVHEFSHAFAATRLGDPTPRYRGRLSLNPLAHLDPVGTMLLFIAGFGWGKPVEVNPRLMRGDPKTNMALTAVAGPLSNLAVAALAGLAIKLDIVPWRSPFNVPNLAYWSADDYLGLYLSSIVLFGIILAVFNLIPLWPLDGFSVAVGILPRDLSQELERMRLLGPGILLLLLFGIPIFTNGNLNPFFDLMRPAVNGLARLLTGVGDPNVFG
jgi:Zn-dependent protease